MPLMASFFCDVALFAVGDTKKISSQVSIGEKCLRGNYYFCNRQGNGKVRCPFFSITL